MITQKDTLLFKKWKKTPVAVALSGGVDSAIAAWLLKSAGAKVRTFFMKNWEDDDTEAGCHDKNDLTTAAAAADILGLDFEVLNFAAEYKAQVFTPFLADLRRGLTPNPDVLCNSEIKFGAFCRHAQKSGAAAVVTGHYARISQTAEGLRLLKGEDSTKDQSYFLHRLTAAQLALAVFPLGDKHKADVRETAKCIGLGNWDKKDSTGICFIGERPFAEFLRNYLPETPGAIQTPEGKTIGEHTGLPFYTIGQRRGLKIGGLSGNDGEAWFVIGKRADDNVLEVAPGENHPRLFADEVKIENAHWIAGKPPPTQWVYSARLRHRQSPASCTLAAADEKTAHLVFAEAQRAPAPGQYAVIYDGNTCLGGGVIAGGLRPMITRHMTV